MGRASSGCSHVCVILRRMGIASIGCSHVGMILRCLGSASIHIHVHIHRMLCYWLQRDCELTRQSALRCLLQRCGSCNGLHWNLLLNCWVNCARQSAWHVLGSSQVIVHGCLLWRNWLKAGRQSARTNGLKAGRQSARTRWLKTGRQSARTRCLQVGWQSASSNGLLLLLQR